MKKLNSATIKILVDNYNDFNELCESIGARIFYLRYQDRTIEEVASIEIIKNTILATISYKKDTDEIRYLTVDFPDSYLTNESWIELEESKAKELKKEIQNYSDFT